MQHYLNNKYNSTHWPVADLNEILDKVILKLILVIDGWAEVSLVKLPSDECH